MKTYCRVCGLTVLVLSIRLAAAVADGYGDAIQSFLRENFDHKNAGMVVGIVDTDGSRDFSAGKLDNGTDQEVTGDTVFEIGSVTKTFTALLLEDMVARGEMKLEDPAAMYLPDSVKLPTHGGKQITLLNLAAQDSGLPFNADNQTGNGAKFYSSYTVPKMYEFLSGYQLTRDPGEKFQYSNIGMGLLGHLMELRAGKDYESQVVERICRPLQMESTRITLTPDLKSRLATGHDEAGKQTDPYEMPAIDGAGALRSTVNDLLKYAAAEVGLTASDLSPLMEQTHAIRHTGVKVRDQFEGKSALPCSTTESINPPARNFWAIPAPPAATTVLSASI